MSPLVETSWPDWQYPIWRAQGGTLTVDGWLDSRRQDDGAEGLWRVHDKLYELSCWVHSHPGGAQWLEDTKGTDITEAFEAHHVGPFAAKMLENFYVRPAKTLRNSPFTFKPDGFYKVLKARVYKKLKGVKPGPSTYSKRYLEFLASSAIILSILAAVYKNFLLGTLAAVFLTMSVICAHNFFHMRDNWRMYLFNMSLLTVRHWRISHAISHHLYPNTHNDLEISQFEPLMEYMPKRDKSRIFGIMSTIYSPLIIYPMVFLGEAIKRSLTSQFHAQDLIALLIPTLMITIGRVPPLDALVMWIYIIMTGSFVFAFIGLTAAHHHPDIFHNGDKPRADRDWGLHTLDATRDRVEITGNKNLVLITFGDHVLHHLFPTVDHVYLPRLYPELEQTCKEFGVEYKLMTQWELVKGQFMQLMRNQPSAKERTSLLCKQLR